MARVFLSLGSNLGDRQRHLDLALERLRAEPAIRLVACSPVYETEPWPEERMGRDRWYFNSAVEIETGLSPRRLLGLLQRIEAAAGRVRGVASPPGAYPDRTLDIDILLYDDRVVSDQDLQIPHPLLHERRFVLRPLADIAPDVEHPTLFQTIREVLESVADTRAVVPHSP